MSELSPVDVNARRALARVMRRFAAGQIDGDEFDHWSNEISLVTKDLCVVDIASTLGFGFEGSPKGTKLTAEHRRLFSKIILFLMTSEEAFPPRPLTNLVAPLALICSGVVGWQLGGWVGSLVGVVATGTVNSALSKRAKTGPYHDPWTDEFFPFASAESLEQAKMVRSPFALQG